MAPKEHARGVVADPRPMPIELIRGVRAIRDRALTPFKVNLEKEYITHPWMNDWSDKHGQGGVDQKLEATAAEYSARLFLGIHFTDVVAIGRSGLSFGKAFSRAVSGLDVETLHHEALKIELGMKPPENDHFIRPIESYTEGVVQFAVPKLKPGAKVIIVDDVLGHGSASAGIVGALQELQPSVEVIGLAVYLEKKFQYGARAFHQVAPDALVTSVIPVESMTDGVIVLSSEKELGYSVHSHVIANTKYPTDDIQI